MYIIKARNYCIYYIIILTYLEEPSSPEYNAESDSDDELNNSKDGEETPSNQDFEDREENRGNIGDKDETVDAKKDENENMDSGLSEKPDGIKHQAEFKSNNDECCNSNPNNDNEIKTSGSNWHAVSRSTAVDPQPIDFSTAVND